MDSQQQQHIYSPLTASIQSVTGNMFTAEDAGVAASNWKIKVYRAYRWVRANWWSWQGLLMIGGVGVALSVLAQMIRFLIARWRKRTRTHSKHAPISQIAFYRKLEKLLARYGMRRDSSQTPREFATAIGGELAQQTEGRIVAPVARQITEAFYRVRFGHHSLDKTEADQVEQSLSDLAAYLASRRT